MCRLVPSTTLGFCVSLMKNAGCWRWERTIASSVELFDVAMLALVAESSGQGATSAKARDP